MYVHSVAVQSSPSFFYFACWPYNRQALTRCRDNIFQSSLFCISASQTFAEGCGDYYFQGERNANEGGPPLIFVNMLKVGL